MLALIGNLSVGETVLIAIVAVLVFGERLPQAMTRAYKEFLRFRDQVDKLRRDSGIDEEVRNIKRTFHETATQARIDSPTNPPVPRTPDYDVQEPHEETDPAAADPTTRFPDYLLESQEKAVREAEAAENETRSNEPEQAGPAREEDDEAGEARPKSETD